ARAGGRGRHPSPPVMSPPPARGDPPPGGKGPFKGGPPPTRRPPPRAPPPIPAIFCATSTASERPRTLSAGYARAAFRVSVRFRTLHTRARAAHMQQDSHLDG